MTRKSDLEVAALSQKVRAERLETREADLEHALNLLINEAVEWFYSSRDANHAVHQFGVGIAMNVPIKNKIAAVAAGRKTEHRIIIFWKTEFSGADRDDPEDEESARGFKYLTVYTPEEFRGLPGRLEGSTEVANESISKIVADAVAGLDNAVKSYLEKRRPFPQVM